jgi:hypothetical protein
MITISRAHIVVMLIASTLVFGYHSVLKSAGIGPVGVAVARFVRLPRGDVAGVKLPKVGVLLPNVPHRSMQCNLPENKDKPPVQIVPILSSQACDTKSETLRSGRSNIKEQSELVSGG